jgi:hypothetical protein
MPTQYASLTLLILLSLQLSICLHALAEEWAGKEFGMRKVAGCGSSVGETWGLVF